MQESDRHTRRSRRCGGRVFQLTPPLRSSLPRKQIACRHYLKQQSRQPRGANGFASVPHTCPPARFGLSDRQRRRATQTSECTVSDKANVFSWRDFFAAVECRIANIDHNAETPTLQSWTTFYFSILIVRVVVAPHFLQA